MGLWMALLQGGVTVLLGECLKQYRRARSIAAGITVGLILFGWLPVALHRSTSAVLACAVALGILHSFFLQECSPHCREALWCGWLMLCSLLQSKGLFGALSLPLLLPVYLATGSPFRPWLHLPILLSGTIAGQFLPLPAKWQGLLLASGCGALLQCIRGIRYSTFAGGIAIGVILSFI